MTRCETGAIRSRRLARASVCTLPKTMRPSQSSCSAFTTEVASPVTVRDGAAVLLDQLVGVLQHQNAVVSAVASSSSPM